MSFTQAQKDAYATVANTMSAFDLYYQGVPGSQSDLDLIHYMNKRKWMVAEIFLLYLIFLLTKLKKNDSNDKEINEKRAKLHEQRFLIFLSQHIIMQGPAIMYGPRDFAVIMIYVHLLVFLLILVGYHKMNEKLVSIAYGVCSFINLLNMLVGLGHLGVVKANTTTNLQKLQ